MYVYSYVSINKKSSRSSLDKEQLAYYVLLYISVYRKNYMGWLESGATHC